MDHLLSLSQAARMVGVSRKVLQGHVQLGDLSVFEGYIRESELLKVFPETKSANADMLEKMSRIQADAVNKYVNDELPDAEHLASEVQRLRAALEAADEKILSYQLLTSQMKSRLNDFDKQCDKKQSLMMRSLIGWFFSQCKLREKH